MKLPPQSPEEIERIRMEVWEENWMFWNEEDNRQRELIDNIRYGDENKTSN